MWPYTAPIKSKREALRLLAHDVGDIQQSLRVVASISTPMGNWSRYHGNALQSA